LKDRELIFLGGVAEARLIKYTKDISRFFPEMTLLDHLGGLRDAGFRRERLLLEARNAEFVTDEVVGCIENHKRPNIKVIDAITWSSGLVYLMRAMPRLSRRFGIIAAVCPPIDSNQIRWNELELSQGDNQYLANWMGPEFWKPVQDQIASLTAGGTRVVAFLPPLDDRVDRENLEAACVAVRTHDPDGDSLEQILGTNIISTACCDGRVQYAVGDIAQMCSLGIEVRHLPVQGHWKAIQDPDNLACIRALFNE